MNKREIVERLKAEFMSITNVKAEYLLAHNITDYCYYTGLAYGYWRSAEIVAKLLDEYSNTDGKHQEYTITCKQV